jgi:hypothetical protein
MFAPDISHTQACVEDVPTTNVYIDDHATRAAPYTLASQFISLASSDEESDGGEAYEEGTSNVRTESGLPRPHSTSSLCMSPYADKQRRSSQHMLLKQLHDNSEKIHEKLNSRGFGRSRAVDSSQEALNREEAAEESSGSSKSKEHKPICSILEEIPKPKFSTKSPSSPAKISSLPKNTSPIKAKSPLTLPVPIVSEACTPTENGTHGKPLVQTPSENNNNNDSDSGSDTEVHPLLDKDAVQQKHLALRGIADGESPRETTTEEPIATLPPPPPPHNPALRGKGRGMYNVILDSIEEFRSRQGAVALHPKLIAQQAKEEEKETPDGSSVCEELKLQLDLAAGEADAAPSDALTPVPNGVHESMEDRGRERSRLRDSEDLTQVRASIDVLLQETQPPNQDEELPKPRPPIGSAPRKNLTTAMRYVPCDVLILSSLSHLFLTDGSVTGQPPVYPARETGVLGLPTPLLLSEASLPLLGNCYQGSV